MALPLLRTGKSGFKFTDDSMWVNTVLPFLKCLSCFCQETEPKLLFTTCLGSKVVGFYFYIYIGGGGGTEDYTQVLSMPDESSASKLYPNFIVKFTQQSQPGRNLIYSRKALIAQAVQVNRQKPWSQHKCF